MDPRSAPRLSAIEAIRKRPGMYIGDLGEWGIEHLIYELVANSIDLFLRGTATKVRVTVTGTKITVFDDGPGLPFEHAGEGADSKAGQWFTQLHHTPTADGHAPHVHLNATGLGLVAVNALSSNLTVVSHRNGTRWEQHFAKGKSVGEPRISESSVKGTAIAFTADREVIQASLPRMHVLRRSLFDAAHLFPGMKFQLNSEVFHAPGGLASYVQFLTMKLGESFSVLPRLFHVRHESEELTLEAAASGTSSGCEWISWCNGTSTWQHGTHVDGFRDALRRQHWTPAVAAINVIMKTPRFAAPTHAKVTSAELRGQVRQIVAAAMKDLGQPDGGTA
jgi:DNA gyrase subunit B